MNVGEGANPRREQPDEGRAWEDCVKYGFMAMGGGESWINQARKPAVGEHLFAYLNTRGYVGYGEIVAMAKPFQDFVPLGERASLMHLDLRASVQHERMLDPATWDMCVGVRWIKALERQNAVCQHRYRLKALEPISSGPMLDELLENFQPASERLQ